MNENWKLKSFNILTASELYDLLQLRQNVFIVEQHCPYTDLDGVDQLSYHLMLHQNNICMAYARIIPPGVLYDEASIGRVVTHIEARRTGLGKRLFERALKETENLFGQQPIRIMAQSYLTKFYESFGFSVVSDEFLEDNIPHYYMIKL
jgi:ElaA protein